MTRKDCVRIAVGVALLGTVGWLVFGRQGSSETPPPPLAANDPVLHRSTSATATAPRFDASLPTLPDMPPGAPRYAPATGPATSAPALGEPPAFPADDSASPPWYHAPAYPGHAGSDPDGMHRADAAYAAEAAPAEESSAVTGGVIPAVYYGHALPDGGADFAGGPAWHPPVWDPSQMPPAAQEPAVRVAWNAPSQMNVGEQAVCELVVRNTGRSPASQVRVEVHMGGSAEMTDCSPAGEPTRDGFAWHLGTLAPEESRTIQATLTAHARGEMVCWADVTCTTAVAAVVPIEEPLLEIVIEGPQEALVGDAIVQTVHVSNPGTGTARGVVVEIQLPPGLECPQGSVLQYPIGALAPGVSQTVQLPSHACAAGEQVVSVTAAAEHATSAAATAAVNIVSPELSVAVDGPRLRYVDRNATYNIRVENAGTATTTNVRVVEQVPAGFEFVAAGQGGSYEAATGRVVWFLGQMDPGAVAELSLELRAAELGEHVHHVVVQADRGVSATCETATLVDGISSVVMQVVDRDDPLEQGAETMYEIRVRNNGSKAGSNIALSVEVSAGLVPVHAEGPTAAQVDEAGVRFAPLAEIAPAEEAVYQVFVVGIAEGDSRLRAALSSNELATPLVVDESTKVYAD